MEITLLSGGADDTGRLAAVDENSVPRGTDTHGRDSGWVSAPLIGSVEERARKLHHSPSLRRACTWRSEGKVELASFFQLYMGSRDPACPCALNLLSMTYNNASHRELWSHSKTLCIKDMALDPM